MGATSATTRLEAVNVMLSIIGQSPVNTLGSGSVDSEVAENILDEVTKEVCAEGWHFNTEKEYVLASLVTGEVPVPTDAAQVDVHRGEVSGNEITVLDGQLYDLTDHTNIFNRSVKVDIIWLRSFDQVPETARRYIMIKAGRQMQDRYVVDPTQHNFTLRDEFTARAKLMIHESDTGDYSMLDTPLAHNTTRRRRSPFRY